MTYIFFIVFNYETLFIKHLQGEEDFFHRRLNSKNEISDAHTIALYINPGHQKEYYDFIVNRKPKRLIFNPGTENKELYKLALVNNIEVAPECLLIMLNNDAF